MLAELGIDENAMSAPVHVSCPVEVFLDGQPPGRVRSDAQQFCCRPQIGGVSTSGGAQMRPSVSGPSWTS
jgi:hypothetical protein